MTPDKLREEAFREFEQWFMTNYPGPETIISDPAWHAPKIFRSATHRIDKAHASALEEVRNLRLLLSDKNADISAMGASRVKAEAAHAAALEELVEERKLCEYFANGSIYWQHKYEAAIEELATMRPFFIKHALGPKAKPSCLCCGRNDYDAVAVQHGELPGIVICDRCKSAAALEEVERLKALTVDLEKEGARAIYTAVQQKERAEKAERRAEHWAEKCEAAWKAGDELTMQRMQADRRAERLQAQVDALMLEYCPDEMTPEQLAEWEKHQRAVPAEFKGE